MKKWFPILMVILFLVWALAALIPKRETGFHTREFGKLPVLLEGRIQPLDSVARKALLQLRGKQTAPLKLHFSIWSESRRGKSMSASAWLIEVFAKPDVADTRKIFRVDHPELLAALKLPEADEAAGEDGKHYSWNQIEPALEFMDRESGRIFERERNKESDVSHRTVFERAVAKLQGALTVYRRLKNSVKPETTGDFGPELTEFQKVIEPGVAAYRAQDAGREYNTNDINRLAEYLENYDRVARFAYPLIIPPHHPEVERDNWMNAGTALMETVRGHKLHSAVTHYAAMLDAYRHDQPEQFNQAVTDYRASLEPTLGKEVAKGSSEFFFSDYAFFYKAINIYVFAFLLACGSWFFWAEPLRRSAHWLMALGFAIHTIGLIYRMVLEGRPPVTNLYSSAVFIGWGVVLFCLFLERIFPLAIATAVATLGGFLTLIIAHGLALGGDDTMKMLQAVLDTNFWLATHVVVITIGYATTFLAGLLAIKYVLLGVFTTRLKEKVSSSSGQPAQQSAGSRGRSAADLTIHQALGKMVYGIICFATLFSFVGTVLGGIWADQSWGRFWGWDPKENGALIIVLWNAIILHARWGGLIRERGLMNLAIFGNIVTAFSWFGVNMLGIGLHSYGFMDAAFKWLMLFNASQCLLIALGLVPLRYWRSFRAAALAEPPAPPTPPLPHGQPVPVGK